MVKKKGVKDKSYEIPPVQLRHWRNVMKKYIGYINLFACILLWASIPVASKKILVELDNYQMLLYSTVFSVVVIGGILLFKRRDISIKYSAVDHLKMAGLGFLGNYLYYIFLYGALSLTSASEGFILAYIWPVLVVILSFFILKEQVTVLKLLSIFICFFGVVVITTQGNLFAFRFTNVTGNIMALIGAFTFALYSVLGKKVNYERVYSVFAYFLTALIFIVPTVYLKSSFLLPSKGVMLWLIYNGIFVNGISYIFWFNALDRCNTSLLSNLLYLTPFVSLIYIRLVLKETILPSAILGLSIIILGVLLSVILPIFKKGKISEEIC